MELLVGLGMIAAFIVIGLNKSNKQENKDGYCNL